MRHLLSPRLLGMVPKAFRFPFSLQRASTLLFLSIRLLFVSHSGEDSPSLSPCSNALLIRSITWCLSGWIHPRAGDEWLAWSLSSYPGGVNRRPVVNASHGIHPSPASLSPPSLLGPQDSNCQEGTQVSPALWVLSGDLNHWLIPENKMIFVQRPLSYSKDRLL